MCCFGLQLYQGGIRNLNLTFVLKEVAWPVIVFLSLCILVPYIILMGVLPQIGELHFSSLAHASIHVCVH